MVKNFNKTQLKEALQFYLDNDLAELISEKEQSHFESNKEVEILAIKTENKSLNKDEKKNNSFIKLELSTNNAISKLAQKSIQNSSGAFEKNSISLNEIIKNAQNVAQNCKNVEELEEAVKNFDGCNLKKMATNTVFKDGNNKAKVMVIGEAPGNHEDLQGIPFCGDSGKVLSEMFEAINMTRVNDYYVTNVIFWRPPGNRRPTPEELAICRPFVERHIELIQPKVIVLVGATAMSALLDVKDTISEIRGKFLEFTPKFLTKPTKTFVIFHPSYLMRQSSKKKIAWQDMLALEQFLQNNND